MHPRSRRALKRLGWEVVGVTGSTHYWVRHVATGIVASIPRDWDRGGRRRQNYTAHLRHVQEKRYCRA